MGRFGVGELILIFAVLLLLFGATRLPGLGASLGSAIRNFKRGFGGEDELPNPDAKGKGALGEGNPSATRPESTRSTDKTG
ncbi:MAG: twin-arginine translocase TatA/TatE family subunit [Myxococcaceae bacterium]